MLPFKGFPKEVFKCCEPSEKIRIPINSLKELKSEIEPDLKKINTAISGHVSRTKVAGTNNYIAWAWLYFNTIGTGAYRYSQLTVNISPSRIYAGVNLKRRSALKTFQNEIMQEENEQLLEEIIDTLGGREWIVSKQDDSWEDQKPRWYSSNEIRGILFDPELHWINACFEKNEAIVDTPKICDEILRIFKELYNIYALAIEDDLTTQPRPRSRIYKPTIVVDSGKTTPKSDEERQLDTKAFLASLKATRKPRGIHLPGRRDQYFVKRTALDLNLKPFKFHLKGEDITIYSNLKLKSLNGKILKNYPDFRKNIGNIENLLKLPKDFLKIMYVDSKSDARYSKSKKSNCIFLNLARFKLNKIFFFWLFAVARELSYIKFPRLDYRFVNLLRDILAIGLENQPR